MLRRSIPGSVRYSGLALLLVAAGCGQCGPRQAPSGAQDDKSLVERLTGLPAAAATTVQVALPAGIDWAIASPDPSAYRAWADAQPFVQRFKKTGLYQEIATHEILGSLQRVQQRVARAAALTGADPESLWDGPLALGITGDEDGHFVAIKAVAPDQETMVRFASTFAVLAEQTGRDDLTAERVDGHSMHTLEHFGRPVSFALFSNMVIVGDDPELVRQAVRRALKPGGPEAGLASLGPEWGRSAGVHVASVFGDADRAAWTGWPAVVASFVPDDDAPIRLLRPGSRSTLQTPTRLSRYLPKAAALAFADGGLVPKDAFQRLTARAAFLGDPAATGGVSVAEAILAKMSPGIVVSIGSTDKRFDMRVVLGHGDKAGLEAPVRKLFRGWAQGTVSRTQTADGDVVFSVAEGPTVGLSDDAMVLGLTVEHVRQSLAAARGTTPSMNDHARWPKDALGGLLIDFNRAAPLLNAFYVDALAEDSADWDDASGSLKEVFDAVAAAGVLSGPFVDTPAGFEGALRVAP